jgi:hypothetical protein
VNPLFREALGSELRVLTRAVKENRSIVSLVLQIECGGNRFDSLPHGLLIETRVKPVHGTGVYLRLDLNVVPAFKSPVDLPEASVLKDELSSCPGQPVLDIGVFPKRLDVGTRDDPEMLRPE